jgi:hypothetical protein
MARIMACDRCSAVVASDGCELNGLFTMPNGAQLFVDVKMTASTDSMRTHGAMFCPECWVLFLEQFGQRAIMKRVVGV